MGSTPGVGRIGRQFGHLVATQSHQVAGAGLQFGLAVPVRRSFQLTHQAIDSNQNSESDIHSQQRDKH
jgi:hypothetical protein